MMTKRSEWANMLVYILIPELGRQRQENCFKFEVIVSYTGSFQVSQGNRARLHFKSWMESMAEWR